MNKIIAKTNYLIKKTKKLKKYWLIFVLSLIIFAGAFLFLRFRNHTMIMGVVADIHAGNKKHRSNPEPAADAQDPENNLIPSDYCKNLQKVFSKSQADFYLALGDNTLDGGAGETDMVVNCVKQYGKSFIWVRGNHDNDAAWKEFGLPNYYAVDKGDWRIIVLYDSVYDPGGVGGIDDAQINWLANEVNTDKNVIIAQHHPLYTDDASQLSNGTNFDKEQQILEAHSNVKYVLTGHRHIFNFCVNKGYTYCNLYAMGLIGHEGSYMNFELK